MRRWPAVQAAAMDLEELRECGLEADVADESQSNANVSKLAEVASVGSTTAGNGSSSSESSSMRNGSEFFRNMLKTEPTYDAIRMASPLKRLTSRDDVGLTTPSKASAAGSDYGTICLVGMDVCVFLAQSNFLLPTSSVRPSDQPSVRPSARPSARPLVRPSVRPPGDPML